MKKNIALVVTTISGSDNPILRQLAKDSQQYGVRFIAAGDMKSPAGFHLEYCDYFDIPAQKNLRFKLSASLPVYRYSRKNIGYLIAMEGGAGVIIETDDDNLPYETFWEERNATPPAVLIRDAGWVNIYKYFSDENIWPRGFALEHLHKGLPDASGTAVALYSPIQQGLADDNPDVDGIYRLTSKLPVKFLERGAIALGEGAWCPFNSQNTTWFSEAFPLLYLPTFCNFRMTDIWRSFVAQRIAWSYGWNILFHQATVYQERNIHDILLDFKDEIPGYLNNGMICKALSEIDLKPDPENIYENMIACYQVFIDRGLIAPEEIGLLNDWIDDCRGITEKNMNL